MHLMFCNECGDAVALRSGQPLRCCTCRMSHGKKLEDGRIEVNKNAAILFLDSNLLYEALAHHDDGETHKTEITGYIVPVPNIKLIP